MEAINWEAVQAVSEALGLIFVVGSLIFVGLQIQQNTQAAKIEAVQNVAAEWRAVIQGTASNNQLSDVVIRGGLEYDSLTMSELAQFNSFMGSIFYVAASAHFHYEKAVLDDDMFNGIRNQLRLFCGMPGVREFWASRKVIFSHGFQQYFDQEILAKESGAMFAQYKDLAEKSGARAS